MERISESNLDNDQTSAVVKLETGTRLNLIRNLVAFWLLGLTNNFGYVVMLSAAHDLLSPDTNSTLVNRSGHLIEHCNDIGTGAILLADILPALLVKLSTPFYIFLLPYWFKVSLTALLSVASFLLVSFGASSVIWLSVIGVICASAGSGLGEVVLLGLSAHFNKNVVSTFSSGTGAAGLFGAISYAGLTRIGVTPSHSLLIMLVIPAIMICTYFLLLAKPASVYCAWSARHLIPDDDVTAACANERVHDAAHETMHRRTNHGATAEEEQLAERSRVEDDETAPLDPNSDKCDKALTRSEKLKVFVWLLRFLIPLMLVYFAEYFINQGLMELIYFEGVWLDVQAQYRWYQVIYQLGVFISRSSVNVVRIRAVAIFPILQFINLALLLLQVFYGYMTSIWIVFAIILFEGLLGGAAYANTFYCIAEESDARHKEFSMGAGCLGDSFGISLAAAAAIPAHNAICQL